MATFILIPGGWQGGWAFEKVAELLVAHGHTAAPLTLAGLGDVPSPSVNLSVHISEAVRAIESHRGDIVLVGHSYGGLVISGVAEKVEKSISSFVMLDAFFPDNGQSLLDLSNELTRNAVEGAAAKGVAAIPPRPAEIFKVNAADVAWVNRQCTPQPIQTFVQKLKLSGARDRIGKKTYIRAAAYANPYFDAALASARTKNWRIYELPCGHDVMLDMPERLAEILQDVA